MSELYDGVFSDVSRGVLVKLTPLG